MDITQAALWLAQIGFSIYVIGYLRRHGSSIVDHFNMIGNLQHRVGMLEQLHGHQSSVNIDIYQKLTNILEKQKCETTKSSTTSS